MSELDDARQAFRKAGLAVQEKLERARRTPKGKEGPWANMAARVADEEEVNRLWRKWLALIPPVEYDWPPLHPGLEFAWACCVKCRAVRYGVVYNHANGLCNHGDVFKVHYYEKAASNKDTHGTFEEWLQRHGLELPDELASARAALDAAIAEAEEEENPWLVSA